MIIFGYISLMAFIRLILPSNTIQKKFYVLLASLLLFLLSSLRNINFASDTIGYVARYLTLSHTSIAVLLLNTIKGIGKDPFFYLFAKMINLAGANFQVWLALIAGIFIYTISKLIVKYSNEPFISIVAFISLGYFYFSLTGLRQTIALSMILISYKYLRDKQLIPFIMLVIFGSLFHTTAIVFIISYPLSNMKVGWKQGVGILIALILSYFLKDKVLLLLNHLIMGDRYKNYLNQGTSLTMSGFIIQLAIYIFCLCFKKDILKADAKNLSLYNLMFLGLIFQAFSTVIAEFFRVSMYFSIFSIVLIPKAILSVKNKNIRVIVYLLVLIALVAYIFWTDDFNGFGFFWQS